MNPEVEQRIIKRLEWQESKLKEQLREFGPNSNASGMTQAYIAALKWVLEVGAKEETNAHHPSTTASREDRYSD